MTETFKSLEELSQSLYKKLSPDYLTLGQEKPRGAKSAQNVILLFAHNAVGKTRLSMVFKNDRKKENGNEAQVLYYNAFTEDLFYWDNDLENDIDYSLVFKTESKFFDFLKGGIAFEDEIREYLDKYACFRFKINYEERRIKFWYEKEGGSGKKGEVEGEQGEDGRSAEKEVKEAQDKDSDQIEFVKLSRAEESIFIWCFFLAIARFAIEEREDYEWVKYLYIDDPVSSLDEENLIRRACDLSELLCPVGDEKTKGEFCSLKVIISSHNLLFLKVLEAELKYKKYRKANYTFYSFIRSNSGAYVLEDSPKAEHLASFDLLEKAIEADEIFTWHFNILRSVLEKTAAFHGQQNFSWCLEGMEDKTLFSRLLNHLSHGRYSMYAPKDMVPDNKLLLKQAVQHYKERFWLK